MMHPMEPRTNQEGFVQWLSPVDRRLWLRNAVIGLAGLVLCLISHYVVGSVRWSILIVGLALLAIAVFIEVVLMTFA